MRRISPRVSFEPVCRILDLEPGLPSYTRPFCACTGSALIGARTPSVPGRGRGKLAVKGRLVRVRVIEIDDLQPFFSGPFAASGLHWDRDCRRWPPQDEGFRVEQLVSPGGAAVRRRFVILSMLSAGTRTIPPGGIKCTPSAERRVMSAAGDPALTANPQG